MICVHVSPFSSWGTPLRINRGAGALKEYSVTRLTVVLVINYKEVFGNHKSFANKIYFAY